jgi:hypothetical protein
VVLHIDDANVDSDAIAIALAYLYGQPPKLTDSNAFRVLAAASFLDLQVYPISMIYFIISFVLHCSVLFFLTYDVVNCRTYVQYVQILSFPSSGHQTFYNTR